jgi:hypothetical protein
MSYDSAEKKKGMTEITLLEGISNESIYGPMQVYFAADVDAKVAELEGEIKRLKNKMEFDVLRLQHELKFLRIDRDEWKNKANLLNVFYYTAEEVDAYKTKVRALVDTSSLISVIMDRAIKEKYIIPKPAMLELIEKFNAAIAALEAEDENS